MQIKQNLLILTILEKIQKMKTENPQGNVNIIDK